MSAPEKTCSICGKEKTPLPERTEQTHEQIFVCTEKAPKKPMPCDGYVYNSATRRV